MQSLIKQKPTDDSVYNFIQKKRSEGKCGKEAMIAGLSKFLRVYYGGSWNCTLNCNLFRKHIYNRCLKLCFHTSALLSPVFNTAFLQLSFQHLNFGYFCRLIFLSRFRLISIHTLCEEGDTKIAQQTLIISNVKSCNFDKSRIIFHYIILINIKYSRFLY